ncbi:hypothetical protein ACVBGC_18315 [Burkholderia stagnalis]
MRDIESKRLHKCAPVARQALSVARDLDGIDFEFGCPPKSFDIRINDPMRSLP